MGISRRKFLGGAGAVVALPALESLLPLRAEAAVTDTPKRLLVYFLPNGRKPATWVPGGTGTGFTFNRAMKALEPLRSDVLATSGLYHSAAMAMPTGDHAKGTGCILTNVASPQPSRLQSGVSLDQLLVQELKPPTRFPSLQWGTGQPAPCDFAASCTYTQTISWAGYGKPLGPISNPLVAFNQLFGGSDPNMSAAEQARRRDAKKSVLDYVLNDANSLSRQITAADPVKLDEYMGSVRELELRITQPAGETCETGPTPAGTLDYPNQVKAFNDMMVLAFKCDQTRFITFMIEYGVSSRTHPFLNAPSGYHATTHNPSALDQLERIETWQCQQAAYVATKLKQEKDAQGVPLLDNTLMLLLPDMGDGDAHVHDDLAPVIVGKLGGAINTGRAFRFNATPLGQFYMSILGAFGSKAQKFGLDGTGQLAGIRTT